MTNRASMNEGNLEPPLHGVAGWLLVLCLFLLVGSPAVSLLGIIAAWFGAAASPVLRSVLTSQAVIELGLAAFAIYAGWALYRVKPNAIKITRAYFITVLGLNLFVLAPILYRAFVSSDAAEGVDFAGLQGPALASAVRQIIVCDAWLAYLARSLRVRATYPKA